MVSQVVYHICKVVQISNLEHPRILSLEFEKVSYLTKYSSTLTIISKLVNSSSVTFFVCTSNVHSVSDLEAAAIRSWWELGYTCSETNFFIVLVSVKSFRGLIFFTSEVLCRNFSGTRSTKEQPLYLKNNPHTTFLIRRLDVKPNWTRTGTAKIFHVFFSWSTVLIQAESILTNKYCNNCTDIRWNILCCMGSCHCILRTPDCSLKFRNEAKIHQKKIVSNDFLPDAQTGSPAQSLLQLSKVSEQSFYWAKIWA